MGCAFSRLVLPWKYRFVVTPIHSSWSSHHHPHPHLSNICQPRHPAPASAFLYSLLCIGGHREHKLSQVSMTLEQRLQLLRWALLAQGLLPCQPHPCHMSPSSSPSTTALLSCASTPGPLHRLLPHPAKRHFLLFFTSLFLNLQVQESLPHSQDALPPHLPTTFPGYPGPFTCTGFTHTCTPLRT